MLFTTEDSTEINSKNKFYVSLATGVVRVLLLITLILAAIPALVILPLKLMKEVIAVTCFVVRRIVKKLNGTAEPLQQYIY